MRKSKRIVVNIFVDVCKACKTSLLNVTQVQKKYFCCNYTDTEIRDECFFDNIIIIPHVFPSMYVWMQRKVSSNDCILLQKKKIVLIAKACDVCTVVI